MQEVMRNVIKPPLKTKALENVTVDENKGDFGGQKRKRKNKRTRVGVPSRPTFGGRKKEATNAVGPSPPPPPLEG